MNLHDEVYEKKMLLYNGGSLFEKSVDDPTSLAQTILGIMIACLWCTEISFKEVAHIKVKFEFLNRTSRGDNSVNNSRRGYSEDSCMRWKLYETSFFQTVWNSEGKTLAN